MGRYDPQYFSPMDAGPYTHISRGNSVVSKFKPHVSRHLDLLQLSKPQLFQELLLALDALGRNSRESFRDSECTLRLLMDQSDSSQILRDLLERSQRLSLPIDVSPKSKPVR